MRVARGSRGAAAPPVASPPSRRRRSRRARAAAALAAGLRRGLPAASRGGSRDLCWRRAPSRRSRSRSRSGSARPSPPCARPPRRPSRPPLRAGRRGVLARVVERDLVDDAGRAALGRVAGLRGRGRRQRRGRPRARRRPTACRASMHRATMVGISAVADDISPRSAARHGPTGAPGPAPRAAVAVAPVAVALVLLSIAVLSNGAFALRQWGPIAFFGLVTLALRAARTGCAGPRWRWSIATWGFALWSLLSITWADAPGRAVEGAGRNLLYAALVSLPLVTLPDRRSALRMAWALTAGLAAVVDPDLRQRAGRRRRAVPRRPPQRPGRLPQRDRRADGDGVLAARLPRRAARTEPAAARRRVQRRHLGARPRVPDAVARRADRLRLRRGRSRWRSGPTGCGARG